MVGQHLPVMPIVNAGQTQRIAGDFGGIDLIRMDGVITPERQHIVRSVSGQIVDYLFCVGITHFQLLCR